MRCFCCPAARWLVVALLAAIPLVGWALRAQEPAGELRTWTDTSGTYTIEARFQQFKDGKVFLEKDGGDTITIPSSQLSREDLTYVRRLLAERRNAGPETPALIAAKAGEWAQWRGPNRDGLCAETGLLDQWTGDGPTLLWQVEGLGQGYSSVSISDGKLYTMGRSGGETKLICLDAEQGTLVWSTPVSSRGSPPNCTPTVDAETGLVYGLSHGGDLVCADARDGTEKWRRSFPRDFGGQMMSGWGYSESPLVDGDRLVCTPGSESAMIASLDKQTGETRWTSAIPDLGRGNDGAGYSSIVVSHAAGLRHYVQLIGKGLIGVSAENGELLWHYGRIANTTANIPTPIVNGDYVFGSTGYNDGGSALLKLSGGRRGLTATEVYYRSSRELQNHHGGMVLVGEHLYLGHGHNRGLPVCVEMRSGDVKWQPGRGAGSGSAAILYADGHIYFRYEDGVMALVEATPAEYRLKGSFKLASVRDKSWPHPVISNGRLYLRDQDALMCYDVRRPAVSQP